MPLRLLPLAALVVLRCRRIRARILRRTTQYLTHSVPRIQLKELAECYLLFIGQAIIAVLMPFVYQAKMIRGNFRNMTPYKSAFASAARLSRLVFILP